MPTALFLGKMQPPHIGHLMTIRSLAIKYENLIVGITESEPSVMVSDNVIEILTGLLPLENVSYIKVPGSVEGGTAVIDVDFDICCSGNMAVLEIMAKDGYAVEYTERSFDSIYSGTNERRVYIESAFQEISKKEELTEFKIVSLSSLRPIEKINPRHFAAIEKEILESGVMLRPIIVDNVTMAVLDGSHRYAFLLKNGFVKAPVVLCNYDNESIFVGTHLGHRFEFDDRKWITKKHVRATAISGQLYEPRTTRHFFPFRKKDFPTKLKQLEHVSPNSIDHLMPPTTKRQELESNLSYIHELETEIEILEAYLAEQLEVKEWLKKQNKLIEGAPD